jgi:hypothetical protein
MYSQDSGIAPTTRIHFIGGEKGGVGKSLMSRVLAQHFIDKETPFTAYDTDKSHGALLRFYSDYSSLVVLDRYEALDRLVEAVAQSRQPAVVDLAAQSYSILAGWIDDSGVLEVVHDMGISLTYWHVMDAGRDSVDLLQKLLDQFGSRLPLVVVLNEVRGTEFDILKESGQLARAESLGASVIRLHKLSDTTMQKIDQFNTSFWAASQSTAGSSAGLALFERQRVKVWLNKAYQQLEGLQV